MIETPAVAFLQSSCDRRSPMTNSTFGRACTSRSSFFRGSSLLEGRTKQRRLAKPYSRSFSTTFEPIKPLDPVTRMHSFGKAMDLRSIMVQNGRQASGAGPAYAKAMTDRATNRVTLIEDAQVRGRAKNSTYQRMWVGVGLIIEYPCAAPPNIKRPVICASVDTRNVCGPIGRASRIWCNSHYVYPIFTAGRTICKRSNTNSSCLHSAYWGRLVIIISVLNKSYAATK